MKKYDKKNIFNQASHVTQERPWAGKRLLPVVMGIIGMTLIGFILHGHQSEKGKQSNAHQKNIETTSALLSQKLAALKEQKSAITALDKSTPSITNNHLSYSKELIARMNAPTSIYENGGSNLSLTKNVSSPSKNINLANNTVQEAILMGKGENQDFANVKYQTSRVEATQVVHPEYTIVSGEMLHAVLNVAMDSDLPGMVTATVTSPAYAYIGNTELIPKGSRLIGQYSSAVLQGQSRMFIMWNRVVLPDGVSVDISSPDTDSIGKAGEPADYINRHFWSRFGESVLLSILSAGVSNVDVQESDQYNSAQAYRIAVADSLQQAATGTLTQTISLKPTLVRYQGAMINVFIAHDLSFYELYKQQGRIL